MHDETRALALDSEALIRLGRIEEKVDSINERLAGQLHDHERRLRRAEYSIWSGAGIMTALTLLAAKFGFHA